MTSLSDCPYTVIGHLGTFLDYRDRLNSSAASKLFSAIHSIKTFHAIFLHNNPDLTTHLCFVKKIKPHLNTLRLVCKDCDELGWLSLVENCCTSVVVHVLSAFHVLQNIDWVYITTRPGSIVSDDDKAALRTARLGNSRNVDLTITGSQCDLLLDVELMTHTNLRSLSINLTGTDRFTQILHQSPHQLPSQYDSAEHRGYVRYGPQQ
jgi:hypothetical protein